MHQTLGKGRPPKARFIGRAGLSPRNGFQKIMEHSQKETTTMVVRWSMIMSALAIGLATPAAAQQASEQDARQAAESVVQAYNKAYQTKDASALAALYTEGATFVTLNGPLVGRAAIEKYYTEGFKAFAAEPAKLDRVIMIGDAARLRIGRWSGVSQSANGPIRVDGYWTTADVQEGKTWKIRMEMDNVTMPSEPSK
jgi:uncharacterized protein (TIGR02246 family)